MTYNNIRPSGGDTGKTRNLHKRLALIETYVDVQGKKMIDCGCGTGQYVEALLGRGADVYGIEYENEKVTQFKQDHPEIAERVQQGNIEAMPFETASFDVALLNEVLEHVPDQSAALLEIRRVLKPNGRLVIFSPNRLYPFETHSVYLKRSNRKLPIYFPFIPYIPLPLGQQIFNYIARNYWPRELRKQVGACGYTVVGSHFLWQTFENISGNQPRVLTVFAPILRRIFSGLERVPIIKKFGVSQFVVAHT